MHSEPGEGATFFFTIEDKTSEIQNEAMENEIDNNDVMENAI